MSTLPVATAAIRPLKSIWRNLTFLPRWAAEALRELDFESDQLAVLDRDEGQRAVADAHHELAARPGVGDDRHVGDVPFHPPVDHVRVDAALLELREEPVELLQQDVFSFRKPTPSGNEKRLSPSTPRVLSSRSISRSGSASLNAASTLPVLTASRRSAGELYCRSVARGQVFSTYST